MEVPSNLHGLLLERDRVLSLIRIKKSEIDGGKVTEIQGVISSLESERHNIMNRMLVIQSSFYRDSQTMTKQEVTEANDELVSHCNRLGEVDSLISENKVTLDTESKKSMSGNSTALTELDALMRELDRNTELVGKEREKVRIYKAKYPDGPQDSSGREKVWIDEPMNVFMWYDKQGVINQTMKDIFKTMSTVPESTYKTIGHKNGSSDMFAGISNPMLPGLSTVLSTLIDLVVKSIGSFGKNFFAFKNGIDMLAGFELGDLLGDGISALTKVLSDLKQFITDPKTWVLKKLMGSLMKLNIPIPGFKFDLGAIIPFLPFVLEIPEIDNLGLLNSLSPFNKKAAGQKIPMDWNKPAVDKTDENLKEKMRRLREISARIRDVEDEIAKYNVSNISSGDELSKLKEQSSKLGRDIKELEDYICSHRTTMGDSEFDSSVSRLNTMVDGKSEVDGRIASFGGTAKSNDTTYIDGLKAELSKLNQERDALKKEIQAILNTIATVLSVETGNRTDVINDRLGKLIDIGVDVTDNDVLHYIQKIGYNFKNETHIDRLKKLGDTISSLSDAKMLLRLFDIGFNINDPNCFEKISTLKSLGIDIRDTKLMSLYNELGFCFSHATAFNTIKDIKGKYNINVGNYDTMLRFSSIGFNFNNPELSDRLGILSSYVDIAGGGQAFDNASKKNANLNNKYIKDVFAKYSSLGLSFGSADIQTSEADIFLNVKPDDVRGVINTLSIFRSGKGYKTSLGVVDDDKMKSYNMTGTDELTGKDITKNSKSLDIKYFIKSINRYERFGVYMKELTDNKLMASDIIPVEMLGGTTYIDNKLNLLLDFVINGGWVVNGVKISSAVGEDDLKAIAMGNGLELSSNLNTRDNQVNKDVMAGVYGNFDKIGLNITDDNYQLKFKTFLSTFKMDIGDSVILNTKRHVYLDTNQKKNDKGEWKTVDKYTIDLGENKPDPEIFEVGDAKFRIDNYLDIGKDKPEVTTVARFDALNNMGFNYQQSDSGNKITSIKSYNFDPSDKQSVYTVKSLTSIGFHMSQPDWEYKLSLLGGIGFRFSTPPTAMVEPDYTGLETANYWAGAVGDLDGDGSTIDVDMSSRLESLNNIGLNFNTEGYVEMFSFLKDVGIDLKSAWAENAINEINNFGINFNDVDWRSKISKFRYFGIDFRTQDWSYKMYNLRQLGIDFNGDDWEASVDKSIRLGAYGLDYSIYETKKKIAVLTSLCIDFTMPEDQYKDKIESLIDIGLVTLGRDDTDYRRKLQSDYDRKCLELDTEITRLKAILDGGDPNPELSKSTGDRIKVLTAGIESLKSSSVNKTGGELMVALGELSAMCAELSELEKLSKELESVTVDKGMIGNDISSLEAVRAGLSKPKPYRKADYRIILSDVEKLRALGELNFSFCDDDHADKMKKLVDVGMDFGSDDWESLLGKLKGLLPVNPITAWIKTIQEMLKTLLTMPMQILFGIIKKLIDLVKTLIGVPLNPAKIPEYAKNLIKKFKSFISMLMKLPTMDGMMDLLFMSTDGLMLVDVFLPGFASFMSTISDRLKATAGSESSSDKKAELTRVRAEWAGKVKGEMDRIDKYNSMLSGEYDKSGIASGMASLSALVDTLGKSLTNATGDSAVSIKAELLNACTRLGELETLGKELEALSDTVASGGVERDKILADIAGATSELDRINRYYSELVKKLESEIKTLEFRAKVSGGLKFCDISANFDEFIKMFNGLKSDIASKTDPDKEKFDGNQARIDEIDGILAGLVKTADNGEVRVKNDIKNLEDYICRNRSVMSDSEFDDAVAELNRLNDVLDAPVGVDVQAGDAEKLRSEMKALKEENDVLKKRIGKNNVNKQSELKKLDNIIKWLPVLVNILCAIPALIVNIVVGIMNAIAYMRNLPVLWEIPYV